MAEWLRTRLRYYGGYDVSMEWKDGKLVSAQISNRDGGFCTVRYGEKTSKLQVKPGKPASLNAELDVEHL